MTQTMKRPREASGPGYRLVEERVEGAVFGQVVKHIILEHNTQNMKM